MTEAPRGGSIRHGEGVKLACFSQESARNLNYGNSVFEETLAAGGKADDQVRRNLLGAFLFSGDSIHKRVGVLSGGEKSRLALLKLLLQESNCLVLDEPTNHLDIRTKEIFQRALLAYGGTLIIVSHDRHFLDELVTRVFEIRDTRLLEYPGNYSEFIARRGDLAESPPPAGAPAADAGPVRKTKEQRRIEAEERNRHLAERRRLKKEVERLEAEIHELETLKARLEGQLSNPDFLSESANIKPAMVELKRCGADLSTRMREWEALVEEMERYSGLE
jgi:ATP-binding cassette, subfamily F, member 3